MHYFLNYLNGSVDGGCKCDGDGNKGHNIIINCGGNSGNSGNTGGNTGGYNGALWELDGNDDLMPGTGDGAAANVPATTTTLGGVIVGEGLRVDENGVISLADDVLREGDFAPEPETSGELISLLDGE